MKTIGRKIITTIVRNLHNKNYIKQIYIDKDIHHRLRVVQHMVEGLHKTFERYFLIIYISGLISVKDFNDIAIFIELILL